MIYFNSLATSLVLVLTTKFVEQISGQLFVVLVYDACDIIEPW